MRQLCRNASALAQRGMWVNGLSDIHCVGVPPDSQRDLTDHVNGAATQDFSVTMRFGRIVEQQLGDAFIAAVGNCPAGGIPRKQAFLTLMPCALAFSPMKPTHTNSGSVYAPLGVTQALKAVDAIPMASQVISS